MKKLIPVVAVIVGLAAGVGAGIVLKPSGATEEKAAEKKDGKGKSEKNLKEAKDAGAKDEKYAKDKGGKAEGSAKDSEFLKLTKQFVVPVVEEDRISALVTMSLSLEARPGISETFYALEPKLRDAFLGVLFDHANMGGFDGTFTQSDNLDFLRKALLHEARKELGTDVSQVLIMSIARQDT